MKKSELEKQISKVAETEVEITIRGEKSFTFSYEGENQKAENGIKAFFKNAVNSLICDYDEECDYTCIYVEV